MSVPLCNVPCSRVKAEGYGNEASPDINEQSIIEIIDCYAKSDCWGVVSGRDGHSILHYENWTYYEKYGNCHSRDNAHRYFYRNEDLRRWDVGDCIDVYLYGSNTRKVRFIKIKNGFWTREYFKSSR